MTFPPGLAANGHIPSCVFGVGAGHMGPTRGVAESLSALGLCYQSLRMKRTFGFLRNTRNHAKQNLATALTILSPLSHSEGSWFGASR